MGSAFDNIVEDSNEAFMSQFGEEAHYEPVGKLMKKVDVIFNPEPSFLNLEMMTLESGAPSALISTTDAYSLTTGAKLVIDIVTWYVLKFQDAGNGWTHLELTKDAP